MAMALEITTTELADMALRSLLFRIRSGGVRVKLIINDQTVQERNNDKN